MKILLHTCCACCACYVVELLREDYDVVMFFSNSNLFPQNEYNKRLENVRKISQKLKTKLVEDKYNNKKWMESVEGNEHEPEGGRRCKICFRFNLERTAKFAVENGFDVFASTLTISPHKDSKLINKIGTDLSKQYNVKYLESDFKKKDGFFNSTKLSKKYNLYRQNYCGCEFSLHQQHSITK